MSEAECCRRMHDIVMADNVTDALSRMIDYLSHAPVTLKSKKQKEMFRMPFRFQRNIMILCMLVISLPSISSPLSPYQQFDGLIRSPLTLEVTLSNGQFAELDAFVTRPSGTGSAPLVLMTNGTEGSRAFDRGIMNPNRMSGTALAFARHGYAAVVVLREGYGHSSGNAEYAGGSCEQPRHQLAGQRDRMDQLAALAVLQRQPWASRENAILAGMSSGGFAVLATSAANPPGVSAVINFDGGRGANKDKSLCDGPGLLTAFERYGATARLPSLWLYSANDQDFSPDMGRTFYNAYRRQGDSAEFREMPPFGKNGHVFMESAPEAFWWQTVSAFLKTHHLPYKEVVSLPDTPLPVPAALNKAGADAFKSYTSSRLYEKAFAISPEGAWGSAYWARTGDDAASIALEHCNTFNRGNKGSCRLYAIGDAVVLR
ncbi:dienelactone hydrolase family protein [Pantoea ananatis]